MLNLYMIYFKKHIHLLSSAAQAIGATLLQQQDGFLIVKNYCMYNCNIAPVSWLSWVISGLPMSTACVYNVKLYSQKLIGIRIRTESAQNACACMHCKITLQT
jgi:hypothetical protein